MELSVYHLAIITVIAFLFFFISFTMSYNNEQATKQYRGGCIKGRDRLKERFEGKGALRWSVDLMPQSLLACFRARKGRQVPLGLRGSS